MNKISTCLWFDNEGEEAANLYVSLFPGGKILDTAQYLVETPSDKPVGSTMTVSFEIGGQEFLALNGGSFFKKNPSISFQVQCATKEEVDELWRVLSDGGKVLMPLSAYPFSEHYGWCDDRFGVSWQLMYVGDQPITQKITPMMLFVGDNAGKAREAAKLYTSVFHNAKLDVLMEYGANEAPDKEGDIKYGRLVLEGQEFGIMDSAHEHHFAFSEAVSFIVTCDTQEEVDYYFEKLSAVPDSEVCGWLKDKYGVSWQITPKQLVELMADPDKEKATRVMAAMMQMKKIDIAKLEEAANG